MSFKRARLLSKGIRFSKFSLVGVSNATVDIGALNFMLALDPTRVPLKLALFNGVAIFLANSNSYLWNTLWTFRDRARHDLRQTALFFLQALFNVGIGSTLFVLLVHPLLAYTSLSTYAAGNVAKAASIVAASLISFLAMRHLVFSRKRRFKRRL